MTKYLFDMDGTLTPPRLPMTEDFADAFVPWLSIHCDWIRLCQGYGTTS